MNEVLNLIDDSVYVHCNRKKTELARSVMDTKRGKNQPFLDLESSLNSK